MNLASFFYDNGTEAGTAASRGRQAKKICAPCCWEISQKPLRYCDAIAVAGEAYCRAHEQQNAAVNKSSKKFGFMSQSKAAIWRIRAWA